MADPTAIVKRNELGIRERDGIIEVIGMSGHALLTLTLTAAVDLATELLSTAEISRERAENGSSSGAPDVR